MNTKCPEYILDPSTLARYFWDRWLALMIADRVDGVDDMPTWDEMRDEEKFCLIDSMEAMVTSQIKNYVDSVELEMNQYKSARPTPPIYQRQQQTESNKTSPCYICGDNPVSNHGDLCAVCYFTYDGDVRG